MIFFFGPFARHLLAAGREEDHVVGEVGVADEVLHAVDHVVVAVAHGAALHAAHVAARVGFAHRHAVHALAADGRQQELLDLLALAGAQDVRRAGDDVLQRVRRGAELAVDQRDAEAVQAATAELGRHVGRVEPGVDATCA